MSKPNEFLYSALVCVFIFGLLFAIKKVVFPHEFVTASGANAARLVLGVFFSVTIAPVIVDEIFGFHHKLTSGHQVEEGEGKRYRTLMFLVIVSAITIGGYWIIDNAKVFTPQKPEPAPLPPEDEMQKPSNNRSHDH